MDIGADGISRSLAKFVAGRQLPPAKIFTHRLGFADHHGRQPVHDMRAERYFPRDPRDAMAKISHKPNEIGRFTASIGRFVVIAPARGRQTPDHDCPDTNGATHRQDNVSHRDSQGQTDSIAGQSSRAAIDNRAVERACGERCPSNRGIVPAPAASVPTKVALVRRHEPRVPPSTESVDAPGTLGTSKRAASVSSAWGGQAGERHAPQPPLVGVDNAPGDRVPIRDEVPDGQLASALR